MPPALLIVVSPSLVLAGTALVAYTIAKLEPMLAPVAQTERE